MSSDAETALNGILRYRQEERSDVDALLALQRECDENLRLAASKIDECARLAPSSGIIPSDGKESAGTKATVGTLRSWLEHQRGLRALYDAAFDRAINHFKNALKESDYDKSNYHLLGVAFTEKHDRTNAVEAYEKFLKSAESNDPRRLGVEKALDKLRTGVIGGKEFRGRGKCLECWSVWPVSPLLEESARAIMEAPSRRLWSSGEEQRSTGSGSTNRTADGWRCG